MKATRKQKLREPSQASLAEVPEIDFKKSKGKRNPYAERIAEQGYTVSVTQGRPRKGKETGPTVPRSIRFPAPVWETLEKLAQAEGLTLHAALRAAVLAWIAEQAPPRHAKG
jgi:hypothetical protein